MSMPNLRSVHLTLSHPDKHPGAPSRRVAQDLTYSFIDIPQALCASHLQLIEYNFLHHDEGLFDSTDADRDVDWVHASQTLLGMHRATNFHEPLQIRLLFDACYEEDEKARAIRRG